METVKDYLAKIELQLSKLDDLLESSRSVPFSSRVSVDKTNIYEIIDEIRPVIEDIGRDLPTEIKQARRIISDGDKIIAEAKTKASMLINSATSEAEKLVEEHEIIKRATQQALQIIDESRKNARDLRKNAVEYADEMLAKAEESVRSTLDRFSSQAQASEEALSNMIDTLYENRKEIRGIKE